VRSTNPWWSLAGGRRTLRDILIGERLAQQLNEKPGDQVMLA
jgi:hypothetical protein